MSGRHEWDWPTRRVLDALGRIHRGERPTLVRRVSTYLRAFVGGRR